MTRESPGKAARIARNRSPAKQTAPPRSVTSVGLVLVPNFSMIAFTSAIEPLRLANRCLGKDRYKWQILSTDGQPVRASNGVKIAVDAAVTSAKELQLVLVCAGLDVETQDHTALIKHLRRFLSFGTAIGAVCTGTFVLAKGGLLDGYQCTIHWENHTGLVAAFPDLNVTQELFEIDRNRLTCAGGTAAIDMMLSMVTRDHGIETAMSVTDQLIHHRMRDATERQRMELRTANGVAHPRILSVIQRMEETIETPVSCVALARDVSISVRQLERLFMRSFSVSPTRYYLRLRLDHARRLLRQTNMPVISVALACGFISASHFSKSYHAHFGCAPSADRTLRIAEAG
jgi:AraC family transcriptional regulator, glycine betaine-responsive activator